MGFDYLSLPKLQRLYRWRLGMDEYFHLTFIIGVIIYPWPQVWSVNITMYCLLSYITGCCEIAMLPTWLPISFWNWKLLKIYFYIRHHSQEFLGHMCSEIYMYDKLQSWAIDRYFNRRLFSKTNIKSLLILLVKYNMLDHYVRLLFPFN